MKIYVKSSISSPYGHIGKGHHDSKLIAARENVTMKEIDAYFDTLKKLDMAVSAAASKAKPKAIPKPKPKPEKDPDVADTNDQDPGEEE